MDRVFFHGRYFPHEYCELRLETKYTKSITKYVALYPCQIGIAVKSAPRWVFRMPVLERPNATKIFVQMRYVLNVQENLPSEKSTMIFDASMTSSRYLRNSLWTGSCSM